MHDVAAVEMIVAVPMIVVQMWNVHRNKIAKSNFEVWKDRSIEG